MSSCTRRSSETQTAQSDPDNDGPTTHAGVSGGTRSLLLALRSLRLQSASRGLAEGAVPLVRGTLTKVGRRMPRGFSGGGSKGALRGLEGSLSLRSGKEFLTALGRRGGRALKGGGDGGAKVLVRGAHVRDSVLELTKKVGELTAGDAALSPHPRSSVGSAGAPKRELASDAGTADGRTRRCSHTPRLSVSLGVAVSVVSGTLMFATFDNVLEHLKERVRCVHKTHQMPLRDFVTAAAAGGAVQGLCLGAWQYRAHGTAAAVAMRHGVTEIVSAAALFGTYEAVKRRVDTLAFSFLFPSQLAGYRLIRDHEEVSLAPPAAAAAVVPAIELVPSLARCSVAAVAGVGAGCVAQLVEQVASHGIGGAFAPHPGSRASLRTVAQAMLALRAGWWVNAAGFVLMEAGLRECDHESLLVYTASSTA